jgi:hypothetical protein
MPEVAWAISSGLALRISIEGYTMGGLLRARKESHASAHRS